MTCLSHLPLWIAIAAASLLAGCEQSREIQPPEILYGQQECEHCRMIISDDRFAAGLVVDTADGQRTSVGFDDVNCMFDYAREHADARVQAYFVHDVSTRQWLIADNATFYLSESLPTPMASGVAAAASRESLADLEREHKGRIADFKALQVQFSQPVSPQQGATP